jgi:hypothetical protein
LHVFGKEDASSRVLVCCPFPWLSLLQNLAFLKAGSYPFYLHSTAHFHHNGQNAMRHKNIGNIITMKTLAKDLSMSVIPTVNNGQKLF